MDFDTAADAYRDRVGLDLSEAGKLGPRAWRVAVYKDIDVLLKNGRFTPLAVALVATVAFVAIAYRQVKAPCRRQPAG